MNRDELKKRLQDHFTDGLVLIIGSGLSCAEGIPGMGELKDHLLVEVPNVLDKEHHADWEPLAADLRAGLDLESAMLKQPPVSEVEAVIVSLTASLIACREAAVLAKVFSGTHVLRLTRLFPHLLKPTRGIPVITTNYDRLVEIATEMAGLGVDSLFAGHSYGRLNPRESRMSFCRDAAVRKGKVYLSYGDRVTLSKPHGSLDWYQHNDEPIRCPLSLSLPRLIITPGRNKFRTGYDRPFDSHRERANREIDRAARFLIVGYGFNDDHLETHLSPRLRDGTPTVILTHSLSTKAQELVKVSSGMFAVSSNPATTSPSALLTSRDGTTTFDGANIWDLGSFVSEVLEP